MQKRLIVLFAGLLVGLKARALNFVPLQVTNSSGLALGAKLCGPDGPGPFPAVVVLHGSGGLWKNDDPVAGEMKRSFLEWGTNLAAAGYIGLFVDSYTARGISEFRNRRPAQDPGLDDSLCSPAYERPKDALAALRLLRSRPTVKKDKIALVAFSQGAETALAAVLHPAIDKPKWTVSFLYKDNTTTNLPVPGPVRLAQGELPFAAAICFYPGCGFYNYFGSPSSTNAGLYYPNTPALILHGSADPLYSGNLYPEKFRGKAAAQALQTGSRHVPLALRVYQNAEHSFDEAILGNDPALDDPNQAAKRAGRALAMLWLQTYLSEFKVEPAPQAAPFAVAFPTLPDRRYLVESTLDLKTWTLATDSQAPTPGHYSQLFPTTRAPAEFFRATLLAPGLEVLP